MPRNKSIQNIFKPDKIPKGAARQGDAGFDNARENIDPHVKTKVVSTKELTLSDSSAAGFVKNDANGKLSGGNSVSAGLWEVDGTETQLITADAIDMQSQKIINVTDPTANQEAATKNYIDNRFDFLKCIFYYKFNTDATDMLLDDSTNKFDLTNVNAATYTASGKVNGAVDTEGNSSQYLKNDAVTGSEMAKIRTIDLWVKPESLTATNQVVLCIGDGTTDNRLIIYIAATTDLIKFSNTVAASTKFEVVSSTTATAGTWIHIIVTFGAAGAKLYINGNTTPEDTDAATNAMTTNFDKLRISMETWATGLDYDGIVDNLIAWDIIKDTAYVTDSYNSGNGKDFKP